MHNFCAAPTCLPQEVLEIAQDELKSWGNTGSSIMEISHRSSTFKEITVKSFENLRTLLSIPDHYKILLMQGGGTGQFSVLPMNLLRGKEMADYVNTGVWSLKAIEEADQYCYVNVAADASESDFIEIPPQDHWDLNPNAAYLHYTDNETVNGIEFHHIPEVDQVPLVSNMSSSFLTKKIDVSKFAVIYASTQKNIGASGLSFVIIREDMIGECMKGTPSLFQYKNLLKSDSIYNSPPTFAWYLTGLVLEWMIQKGGLDEFEKINKSKSNKLYDMIDSSDFYNNSIDKSCRSRINIPFTVGNSDRDDLFLQEAEKNGLMNLNAYRLIGGMRASLYNAISEDAVNSLVEFMKEFERKQG